MLGKENLQKVLIAAVRVANKIDEVTQDGFQLLPDAIALLPNVSDLVTALRDGKAAVAELKNLDDTERAEILTAIKNEFNLVDDDLENVLEKALDAINAIADLIVAIRNARKKD